MLSKFFLYFTLIVLGSCSKKSDPPKESTVPEVNNPVTRYADTLRQDVQKARDAADMANERIAQTQAQIKEFQQE